MPFYTGTITNGGGAGLRDKVVECALLSPQWTQKASGNTGTYGWVLLENDGSHAWAGGRKFYVLLSANATTDLRVAVAEEYDAVNGLVGCTTRSVSSVNTDALGRKTGYSVLSANGTHSSNLYLTNVPTAATYTYWIAVRPEGLFIRHSADSTTCAYAYAGLFESYLAQFYPANPTWDFPLAVVCADRQQTDSYSVFTRAPGRASVTGLSYAFSMQWDYLTGAVAGNIPTGLPALGGKSLLSRLSLNMTNSNGWIQRGVLPDWLLCSYTLESGVVVNDTITIGGMTYRLMNAPDRLWVGEVA